MIKETTFSFPSSSLTDQDVYSQTEIRVIQDERLKSDLPFYACTVEENSRIFTFEGSKFIENAIRCSERRTQFQNPLTRVPIKKFSVFKSTKESREFTYIGDETLVKIEVLSLPILCSDPERSNEEKGKLYFILAECYRTGDKCCQDAALAIHNFRLSARLGHADGQYNLSCLLKGAESLYWGLKYWRSKQVIPMNGLLQLAFAFEDCKLSNFALRCYEQAAKLGSSYAVKKIEKTTSFWNRYLSWLFINESMDKLPDPDQLFPSLAKV